MSTNFQSMSKFLNVAQLVASMLRTRKLVKAATTAFEITLLHWSVGKTLQDWPLVSSGFPRVFDSPLLVTPSTRTAGDHETRGHCHGCFRRSYLEASSCRGGLQHVRSSGGYVGRAKCPTRRRPERERAGFFQGETVKVPHLS